MGETRRHSPIRRIKSEKSFALAAHSLQLGAVIGFADADGLTKTKAFVVLRPDSQTDQAALKEFVKDRLAHPKYPRQIEFVAELPKTATGKIQRFKLREEKAQGRAAARQTFACDAARAPIGRLWRRARVGARRRPRRRSADGAARAQPAVDWAKIDDLIYGCANLDGEVTRALIRKARIAVIENEFGCAEFLTRTSATETSRHRLLREPVVGGG